MKISTSNLIEKLILITSIIFVLVIWHTGNYYSNLVAIMVLIIGIYSTIKSRKNPLTFFLFLVMLYFDYSIIISKYISSTPNFQLFFNKLYFEDTMFIGIASLYLFHAILLLFLKRNIFEKKEQLFNYNYALKIKNEK